MIGGISGVSGGYGIQTMAGASARMPPEAKMTSLFNKIDTSGSGSISKSQFVRAFNTMRPTAGFRAMGADAVFSALDPYNSGSVSQSNFVSGMTSLMAQFRSGS